MLAQALQALSGLLGNNSDGSGTQVYAAPNAQPLITGTNIGGRILQNGYVFDPTQPTVGGGSNLGNMGQGTGLGWNTQTGSMLFQGLQAIGGLMGSMQQNKLAKDQFKTAKEFGNINLNNQIKSYNTALTDRINSRAVMQGMSDTERDNIIAKNSLSR